MTRFRDALSDNVDRLRRVGLKRVGASVRRIATPQGALSMVELPGKGPLPPVTFIHGLSAKCIDFDRVMMRLANHCQALRAIDLPGHGWSDTPRDGMSQGPFLEMLTHAADIFLDRPNHIVGSSLGGLMSIRLAQHNPEAIRSLSLIAPAGTMSTQAQLDVVLKNFEVERFSGALSFVDKCMGENPPIRPLMALAMQTRITQPSIQSLLTEFSPEWLLEPDEIRALIPPVLLYWGLKDGILTRPSLDYYRAHLPDGSHIYTCPSEGHAPWLDGPMMDGSQTFITPLLDFWRSL